MNNIININDINALRDISLIANRKNIGIILIGRYAVLLAFNMRYNIPSPTDTEDLDIAVQVSDWAAFNKLKNALIEERNPLFKKEKYIHRFRHKEGTLIDIIPFGGLEQENGTIIWPQDDQRMNVSSFREVYSNAEFFSLRKDLKVRIATVPGLVVLKFFAFDDRNVGTTKDLVDLYHIMKNYNQANNEDRIFEEGIFQELQEIFLNDKPDIEVAGAYLVGVDVRSFISQNTLKGIIDIIKKFKLTDPSSTKIYSLINRLGSETEIEKELRLISKLFEAFQAGISKEK